MENYYNEFIGKFISGVYRDGKDVVLEGVREGLDIVLEPYGDCCSSTWIESIDIVENLLGATIQKIEDIDMPQKGNVGTLNHPYVDQVAYYGLRITTDKGVSVLDYRNDSNGYYGGSVLIHFREKKERLYSSRSI
jgi:hypothetical protein